MNSYFLNRSGYSAAALLFLCCILISLNGQTTPPVSDTQRGVELYQKGDPATASMILQQVVKRNAKDAEAWHVLGLAYFKLDRFKDAQKAFEKAIKLRPNFVPSHTSLAYIHLMKNKLKEAAKEADVALKLDAANATAHYISGAVNLRQGKAEAARREAESALAADPKMGPAMVLKSEALVELFDDVGDAEPRNDPRPRYQYLRDAAQVLETYLTLYPNDEDHEYWLAQLQTLKVYSSTPDPNTDAQPYPPGAVTTKAKIISKPIPQYTEYARTNGYQGRVRIRLVLSFDGRVKHLLVLNHLGGGLTEQAIHAAEGIRFLPATINGKPVSQFVVVEYNFNIY